ncbi:MAG: thioesterase family protein [Alphaproteobacteria bacterium]|jgi:acyl-CoA thioester hydrolase|nr:thioesterase family protein [Alphaproteobacteria bacterium]MDP6564107.1 thioesterase family protein [Alphaproteobacteria bacterium]MDP6814742.1 thioesterase family protein [Alphaproteobacteria bacterium]
MSNTAPDIDLTDPDGFSYWVTENIRIADTDAGGHVNNTAYAAYAESGRVSVLRRLMSERGTADRWVIARLAIDFRAEAQPPGEVRIGTRLVRLGTKSVTFGHGMFTDGRCIATAQSTMVFMQAANSAAIPQSVRDLLTEI